MNRSPIYRARRSRGAPGLPARKRLALFLATGLTLVIVGADLGRGVVLSLQPAGAQPAAAVAADDGHSLTLEIISRLGIVLGGKPAIASQPSPAPTAKPAPTLTPVPQELPPVVEQSAPAAQPIAVFVPAELPSELPSEPIVESEPISTTGELATPAPIVDSEPIATTGEITGTDSLTTTDTMAGTDPGTAGEGGQPSAGTTGVAQATPTEQGADGQVLPPTPAPADAYALPTEDAALPAQTDVMTGTAGLAPPADTRAVSETP